MTEKTTTGFSKYSAAIAICSGVVLSLAILTFSNLVTTPNRNNPFFSYGTGDNRNGVIQVVDSNRVEVPIAFDIGLETAEVNLEISGEHSGLSGIALTDKTVPVVNGKAVSSVIIQFEASPGLKAGTHYLTLVAKEISSGRIVREGEIQFTYNMHEVIGKCSC